MEIFKSLYKEAGGGLKGTQSVTRGFSATMARDSVASAFYFSSYEWLKRQLTAEGEKAPGTAATLFAGGMAGIFNWAGALPLDTMKSKFQIAAEGQYTGILLGKKPTPRAVSEMDPHTHTHTHTHTHRLLGRCISLHRAHRVGETKVLRGGPTENYFRQRKTTFVRTGPRLIFSAPRVSTHCVRRNTRDTRGPNNAVYPLC